ncbi:hypothetical protein [Arthrobacter sp. NicSoilB11]|uniref:hypothetical protein n=1 Tax=Arthrobacter sp. NicSoilB11 TaxID=2830999 RepID=UPI001CC7E113|nr:hypothetical protein [Arthrobacter sp. NicSoilB11]BCW75469.1 hypothetical protein NicSoilB11_17940 [Arthrobacter sp. NicSoilB11]
MSPDQFGSLAVNVGIYVALIAFVLYRQMRAQPLRVRRLVLFPAGLGLIGLQQLARQPLAMDVGGAAVFVAGIVIGLAAGLWRGTTFRVWADAGYAMVKGTAMTLVAWAVLMGMRLPFALFDPSSHHPQGLVVGELLLALAISFAGQNAVVWAHAKRIHVDRPPSFIPSGSSRP